MDPAYDTKFEEMKQYIPFLERMILKLETNSGNNPRQAQLDKIRSIRDLLMDTKKRMKMENLLKCEQVLMNLYAKVEQKDTLPGIIPGSNRNRVPEAPEPPDITPLDVSRTKLQRISKDTLPEIQRLSETEELCSPGSKEPALFQRRPTPTPKRNYTRVLVSPPDSARRWRPDSTPEKPLFSRRSPRHSPRKTSPGPSYRPLKKSSNSEEKYANVMRKLPEDSLSKLSKEDLGMLSYNDPDIIMDMELSEHERKKILKLENERKKILKKLINMGPTDDISDQISKKILKKKSRKKSKKEIEEGELSDSESEAIGMVYGDIDKDHQSVSQSEGPVEKNIGKTSKIQISLVEKERKSDYPQNKSNNNNDEPELVMIEKEKPAVPSNTSKDSDEASKNFKVCDTDTTEKNTPQPLTKGTKTPVIITIDEEENDDKIKKPNQEFQAKSDDDVSYVGSTTIDTEFLLESLEGKNSRTKKSFKPNFYNEQTNENDNVPNNQHKLNDAVTTTNKDKVTTDGQVEEINNRKKCQEQVKETATGDGDKNDKTSERTASNEEISLPNTEPIVSKPTKTAPVSEIDILQALKNDILNENLPIPVAEPTPALHQPKVTKVVNAEDVTKRTISIEKYKEKSVASPRRRTSLFICPTKYLTSEDAKKQSLKLTNKECERFQFPTNLAGHSSDEETEPLTSDPDGPASPDNVPKSPENLETVSIHPTSPIIIPVDPVPSTVQSVTQSRSDIDMRLLSPPNQPLLKDAQLELNKNQSSTESTKKPVLVDPRVRRDMNRGAVSNSPNPRANNPERTPLMGTPNMTPSRTPLPLFDEDDRSSRPKHVYAPILSSGNSCDYRERSINRDNRNPQWEPNFDPRSERSRSRWKPPERRQFNDRNSRSTSVHKDLAPEYQKSRQCYPEKYENITHPHNNRDGYYNQMDGGRTPVHSFGRSECPTTPTPSFGRQECPRTPIHPFGRGDCPTTPIPSFGRDGPMTPNHPFGREMPMTPNHPFGRSECPPKPSPPFGRHDMPMTPSHPFGRSDCPRTPNHPFGRGEMPVTPSHPFGRSENPQNQSQKFVKDPRLNRTTEYDDRSRNFERNRDYYDRRHPDQNRPMMNFPRYGRERSVGGNDTSYDIGRGSRDPEWNERFSRGNRATSAIRDFPQYGDAPRDYRGYDRFEQRKNVKQVPSQGRFDDPQSDNFRSQRATSIGRNNNTLSVESQSGRSFVIDTSVNSTFQEFLNEKGLKEFGFTFDSRRKRASSVGRFLGSEVKEGSAHDHCNTPSRCIDSSTDIERFTNPQTCTWGDSNNSGYKKLVHYVRARSVGRDIADLKTRGKSFNEVKADLQSFSISKKKMETCSKNTSEKNMYKDPRSRKDMHKMQQNVTNSSSKTDKSSYSPRKNNRDPRMHREQQDHKSKYKLDNRHKRSGIVYTNDNIASGSILRTGYGVKNYKIPKIKKTVEETDEMKVKPDKTSTDKMENKHSSKKSGCKPSETPVHHNKALKNVEDRTRLSMDKKIAKVVIVKEDLAKKSVSGKKVNPLNSETIKEKSDGSRVTHGTSRSSSRRRSVSYDSKKLENEKTQNQRKAKKAIIESDSEDDSDNNKTRKPDESKNLINENSKCSEVSVSNEDKAVEMDEDIFDNSFTIDDLEVSSDPHINANTLVASIDSLIEDLDKDLNSKADSVIGLESTLDSHAMLEGTVTVSPEPKEFDVEESLHDISEVISEDLSITTAEHNLESLTDKENDDKKHKSELPTNKQNYYTKQDDGDEPSKQNVAEETEISSSPSKNNNTIYAQAIVSTTEPAADGPALEDKVDFSKLTEVSTTEPAADGPVLEDKVDFSKSTEVSTTEPAADGPALEDKVDLSKSTEDHDIERCSTPDSTINTIEPIDSKTRELLPASSKAATNEMNPDVTSTHDPHEGNTKDSESILGGLLSILKDKPKFKMLLSQLSGTEDIKKMKKILEKLSEIESDDEDSGAENNEDENTQSNILEDPEAQINEFEDAGAQNEKDKQCKNVAGNLYTTLENDTGKQLEETVEQEKHEIKLNVKTSKGDLQTSKVDRQTCIDKVKTTNLDSDMQKTNAPEIPKKSGRKLGKGKGKTKKIITKKSKRITRAEVAKNKSKTSRELRQLQEDLKEMFEKGDIPSYTGLRMCRLAKLVNTTNVQQEDSFKNDKSDPVVVLQSYKNKLQSEFEDEPQPKVRRKPGPKPKKPIIETSTEKSLGNQSIKSSLKSKPVPKSKTKHNAVQDDPYEFETDSVSDLTTVGSMHTDSSEYESDSLASSHSFGSSEFLVDLKKKKRKKPGWKSGVISKKKKKTETKQPDAEDSPAQNKQIVVPETPTVQRKFNIPDKKCFTDKMYCFCKNVSVYSCRLCDYKNSDIVNHYKKKHPHTEIPLSRFAPAIAEKAINQSADVNFQAICRVPSERYVCRFCFKEFKKASALETFFWHVVSMHTGEYKQTCPQCINVTSCPCNLDIPPPPKTAKGQLIGYMCEKCNFTQISLENLKTHVAVRHDDEHTPVCTVNYSEMTEKMMKILALRGEELEAEEPRKLRSSNQSSTGMSDDRTDCSESTDYDSVKEKKANETERKPKNYASKIAFEEDIDDYDDSETSVKIENEKIQTENYEVGRAVDSKDIFEQPHFKVCYNTSGAKEYVCCVNGKDNHYKTSLMISMKKHVQSKHYEVWDGYCFICKVIVTTQGGHLFKECLQHYIEKHIDNFPLLEVNTHPATDTAIIPPEVPIETPASPVAVQSFLSVRPIDQLVNETVATTEVAKESPPKIQETVSLRVPTPTVETPLPSPSYPETVSVSSVITQLSSTQKPTVKRIFATPEEIRRYEEVQAEVMSKKHHVVLQTMLSAESLSRIYKCAGRYCSFTSDSAEAAWSHASTHQRQGGVNALICCYCDFNSKNNASELVTHVFKVHGKCQYSCGMCFYRAVASQLVLAHIKRVHDSVTTQVVVLEATANYAAKEVVVPLSRDFAVKYYTCINEEATCKYKTFILDKFNDHLAKHGAPFKCSVCNAGFLSTVELSQHLKGHSLNLYQCTWCVHGADNEADLLAHASARHPGKQPQAYLRTINNKDPGKQMVLPLAKLNKETVKTQVVTAPLNSEDPVREAERSIDLEKLIGSVGSVESMEQETVDVIDDDEPLEIPLSPSDMDTETNLLEVPKTPELSEPPPASTADDISTRVTHVVKTESQDEPIIIETPANNIVICLDSDEEEPRSEPEPPKNIIDLSEEDAPATLRKISARSDDKVSNNSVFSCARCYMSAKTLPAFKKHINVCYTPGTTLKCAHCAFETESKDSLFLHYNYIHFKTNKDLNKTVEKLESRVSKSDATITPTPKPSENSENIFICEVCDYRDLSLAQVKTHLKYQHNITNYIVTSRVTRNSNGMNVEYTVREVKKPGPKRKRSDSSIDSPSKRIRYSLQDLDLLPKKPILDEHTYCAECDFSTKVRLNLVRHLQQHADQLIVPNSVPVNPVPHLETNEKHFDKMVNLASSSIEMAREKPAKTVGSPTVTQHIPPEATSRYPKYVPDRQRHTCGAKGCSYISVDQAMLKRHWEALHDGINDYHCVHCPAYQQLDTSTALTAARILGHLRMHDVNLYACSSCPYYHHKKNIVDKHVTDVHKGTGKVMIVREEVTTPAPAPSPSQPPVTAPTMDLKPWQCGLCKFKSLLRPEVIEHCTTNHNSRMQFKCPNCPFRTSTVENVSKHKAKSHPNSEEDVFYYYYREGSIPDEADGTPLWQKQRQKMGNPEPEVKTEEPAPSTELLPPLAPISAPPLVDLSKVKKEFPDPEETVEELCNKYGEFCAPNGLKYKCPLCKVVMEDSADAMQSHLFEELKYRKWGCSICPYKAFHKRGLNEHMFLEHRQRTLGAIELPLDNCIERWVDKLLEYQATLIEKNKQIVKHPVCIEKLPGPTTPPKPNITQEMAMPIEEDRLKTLEQAFGQLGAPKDLNFCCPKCKLEVKDEMTFKDHLEIELNKIRWRCSNCSSSSQTYHEIQLHCKTCTGQAPAHPVKAVGDPALRKSWINAAIQVQKQAMNIVDDIHTTSDDNIANAGLLEPANSLLVVRYEEEIPMPEVERLAMRKQLAPLHFVPATSAQASPESDEERLVIDEHDKDKPDKPAPKKPVLKNTSGYECQFCDFTSKYNQVVQSHMLRHYNLKPYSCNYCTHTCNKKSKQNHNSKFHPEKKISFSKTALPTGPPKAAIVTKKGPKPRTKSVVIEDQPEKQDVPDVPVPVVICLVCEKSMAETEKQAHAHDQFATKGQVVVKCCACLKLFLDLRALQEHHSLCHSKEAINYAFYKMHHDKREIIVCSHCNKKFKFMKDIKIHHNTVHSSLQMKYETKPYIPEFNDILDLTEDADPLASPEIDNKPLPVEPVLKKVAKKSTTKLPTNIAKKSTAKLPFLALNEEESSESDFVEDEYSFYGKKPQLVEKLANIAVMPRDVKAVIPKNVMAVMPNDSESPLSLDKLKKIIPIEPQLFIADIKKSDPVKN